MRKVLRAIKVGKAKTVPWTRYDEFMDVLDKLENYAGQYEHGNYSAARELVRDLRRMVKEMWNETSA